MLHSHLVIHLIYFASLRRESSAQDLGYSCLTKPDTVVNIAHIQEFLLVFPLKNTSFQSRNNNKTNMLCSPSLKKITHRTNVMIYRAFD